MAVHFLFYCWWFQAKQRSFALEQRSRELAIVQSKQVKTVVSYLLFLFIIILLQRHNNKLNTCSSRNHIERLFPLQDLLVFLPVGSPLSLSSSIPSSLAATPPSPAPLGAPGSALSSGMNANALPFYPTSETVESVVGRFCTEISDTHVKRFCRYRSANNCRSGVCCVCVL